VYIRKLNFFPLSFFLSLVKHGIVPMRYHCLYGMHRREEKQRRPPPPPSPSSSTHRGQQTLTNTLPMTIIEKKTRRGRKKKTPIHTLIHTKIEEFSIIRFRLEYTHHVLYVEHFYRVLSLSLFSLFDSSSMYTNEKERRTRR